MVDPDRPQITITRGITDVNSMPDIEGKNTQ
jgi:hypothetical protein